jgi:hypothetical protein
VTLFRFDIVIDLLIIYSLVVVCSKEIHSKRQFMMMPLARLHQCGERRMSKYAQTPIHDTLNSFLSSHPWAISISNRRSLQNQQKALKTQGASNTPQPNLPCQVRPVLLCSLARHVRRYKRQSEGSAEIAHDGVSFGTRKSIWLDVLAVLAYRG